MSSAGKAISGQNRSGSEVDELVLAGVVNERIDAQQGCRISVAQLNTSSLPARCGGAVDVGVLVGEIIRAHGTCDSLHDRWPAITCEAA